jgi:hypothetical protein
LELLKGKTRVASLPGKAGLKAMTLTLTSVLGENFDGIKYWITYKFPTKLKSYSQRYMRKLRESPIIVSTPYTTRFTEWTF